MIPDFDVVARADEAVLSYSCFICGLKMEGPYEAVMRLLSIHSAEHSSDGTKMEP